MCVAAAANVIVAWNMSGTKPEQLRTSYPRKVERGEHREIKVPTKTGLGGQQFPYVVIQITT